MSVTEIESSVAGTTTLDREWRFPGQIFLSVRLLGKIFL
jgi:hypothetical protein